jgi:hypothetical protein
MQKVGILIPTIFSRPEYIHLAAASIRSAGNAHLSLACPKPTGEKVQLLNQLRVAHAIDEVKIEDRDHSLSEKINAALNTLPSSCEYIGWLGDDDLLIPGALDEAARYLDNHSECVMVYGGVDYIDKNGRVIFTNRGSSSYARLLSFGPQLVPQPGALWRRDAFERVGGLSPEFDLAFDFDLFLKLKQIGELHYIGKTLAQFRWHPDSLSVKRRWVSVSEASRVRRKHYKGVMRIVWPLWEPWVMVATWLAGKLVSLRLMLTAGR